MFLGIDMFSGKYAMLPQYIDMGKVTDVELRDGRYDHLFLSSNPDKTLDDIYADWEFDTKINADFNGTLEGGNAGFSLKNTDTIIIRRREKGTQRREMNWVTIYTIPVSTIDDFNFIQFYNYCRADADYEFMLTSSIHGVENSYITTDCFSDFNGLCITDKDHFYRTIANVEPIEFTRNINNNALELFHGKYPVVVSNDNNNYDSGTVSACFLKIEDCNLITKYEAVRYREEFMNWLTNKKAKILKLDNGRLEMIQVVDKPTETDDGHPELRKITFNFVEIGHTDDEEALYETNLSDVEPGRW